jgi:tetratricopeptide (TPR) repeat protein
MIGTWARSFTHAIDMSKDIAHTSSLGADTYVTGFDISRQLGYEGACFVRLHQPERAVPILQKALDSISPAAIRRCATLYTDMSSAYAQLGEVEPACSFARQALDITARIKSPSTLQRLYDVRGELKPWKTNTPVMSLTEQMAKETL